MYVFDPKKVLVEFTKIFGQRDWRRSFCGESMLLTKWRIFGKVDHDTQFADDVQNAYI